MRNRLFVIASVLALAGCSASGTEHESTESATTAPAGEAAPDGEPSGDVETGQTVNPTDEGPVTFLLIGTDARSGDADDWSPGAQRADTIMVMHVGATTISTMSIPRDSWVDIDGYGQAKINAAYSYGGTDLLVSTVEDLIDHEIDHTLTVTFDSFATIIDHLGPIEVETTDGVRSLTGDEALAFVRERYSLPGGDFDRARRQQAVIKQVFSELSTASTTELATLAFDLASEISFDGQLGNTEIADVASLVSDQDMVMFLAPIIGTDWSADGQSIVVLDEEKIEGLQDAYDADEVSQWLAEAHVETTGPVR